MITRSMVVALSGMLVGTVAQANTITLSHSLNASDLTGIISIDGFSFPGEGSDTLGIEDPYVSFQPFDPSFGTLVSAALTFKGILVPGYEVIGEPTESPLPPLPETPSVNFLLDGAISPAIPAGHYGALPPFATESAYEHSAGVLIYAAAGESFSTTIPLALDYLTDVGFPFSVAVTAGTRIGPLYGVKNTNFEDGTALQSSITVTYEYSAVPEPASLAVLAMPLGLLLMRRRRTR